MNMQPSASFDEMIENVKIVSTSIPETDSRIGMLVFFPGKAMTNYRHAVIGYVVHSNSFFCIAVAARHPGLWKVQPP